MPDQATGSTRAAAQPSAVLTHHWLVRRRGGEKVLEALARLAPGAPIYTLVYDAEGMGLSEGGARPDDPLAGRAIHKSWLQRIPGARRHYPRLMPLMASAARRMRLPPVELVICSDAAVAKAMTPHAGSRVVCYCHSPPRYAYDAAICAEYRAALPWAARPIWDWAIPRLRDADRRAAQRVDQFVANSAHVAERIRRWYGRDSVVVHPPVELPKAPPETSDGTVEQSGRMFGQADEPADRSTGRAARGDHYLCVGYHAPYKRLDLAIGACVRLGRRLVVIGEGPGVPPPERRVEWAQRGIEFRGWCSDEEIRAAYASARGLLFCGEEDFGIVPVEAIAHGCPVVAYGVGGATETVQPGVSGVWFERQEVASVVAALEQLESMRFDARRMYEAAQVFSLERFLEKMQRVLAV